MSTTDSPLATNDQDADATSELDHIVAAVAAKIATQRLPSSTYRLQFNSRLTFRQAATLAPYLAQLGISDVYASPLLRARAGSPHGYDVVNHDEINPEIGTRAEFDAMVEAFQQAGLGLLLDVVPNHMAASSNENPWWWDVLENGPNSPFAAYFDIDWLPVKPDLAGKLLLPMLADQFGKVLEAGELVVKRSDQGSFYLSYFDHRFPITPRSYALILELNLDSFSSEVGVDDVNLTELRSILTSIHHLPTDGEANLERIQEGLREKEVIKRRLNTLLSASPAMTRFITENLRRLNGVRNDPVSFDALESLLSRQFYRLAYWRVAADEINYRRFFDINELAAISMERPAVFEATHRLVFELIERGQVTGLRIDHPDGLFDPPEYFRQLQEWRFLQLARSVSPGLQTRPGLEEQLASLWRTAGSLPGAVLSRPLYVVVEKILEPGETLPADWLTHGTVGYEFLNALNGLFVNPAGTKHCTTAYARLNGEAHSFSDIARSCKRLIVHQSMASELTVLAYRLDRISEQNRWTRDFTLNTLMRALEEVITCLDVYRTYVKPDHVLMRDRRYVQAAVSEAALRNPTMSASIFAFLRDVWLLETRDHVDEDEMREVVQFVGKFQQLTGPIMAKSLEDTAFYRFNRLISLNEVGGQPQQFGVSRQTFHDLNSSRLPQLSRGLSATSTHDTKRSEDLRARISVLSEVSRDWRTIVHRWIRQNERHKTDIGGQLAPSRNDEFHLYQTLVGLWPGKSPSSEELSEFIQRVKTYMEKVSHEAKVHTSWTNPNDSYDQAQTQFIEGIFQRRGRGSFIESLNLFARRVAEHGIWNGLSQTVLKVASPGVADCYQGTELWALNLVDPDNRQPVDFSSRQTALAQIYADWRKLLDVSGDASPFDEWFARLEQNQGSSDGIPALLKSLLDSRHDGRIKLFCLLMSLQARRRDPELFADGQYHVPATTGRLEEHIVVLMRSLANRRLLVVVPRWTVEVIGFGGSPPLGEAWGDTAVELPDDFESLVWTDVFTGRCHTALQRRLKVSELLAEWPVALLLGNPLSTSELDATTSN